MPRQQRQMASSARQKVLSRRRLALIALVVAVPLTLALALFTGSVPFLILNLVIDVILAGYIAMLLQIKQGQGNPRYISQEFGDEEEVSVVPR